MKTDLKEIFIPGTKLNIIVSGFLALAVTWFVWYYTWTTGEPEQYGVERFDS